MDRELDPAALRLLPELGEGVGAEMQSDRVGWAKVQGVGAAASDSRHGYRHRRLDTRSGFKHVSDSVKGDQGQVAGKQQDRVGASLDRSYDAARRSHVLTFLTRLRQDLDPPSPRQRRHFLASGHDQHVVAGNRRAHRQLRVAPGQGPAGLRAERRLQPLLGGVEILDQHDYPGRRLRHPLAAPLLAQARQDLLAVELQETQLVIARSMKDEMVESQLEVWLQLLYVLILVVRHHPFPVRYLFAPAVKALHLTLTSNFHLRFHW